MRIRFSPLPVVVLALLPLAPTTAMAQNHSQIATVRNGVSCPRCNLFQAELGGLQVRAINLSGARLRQADMSLSVLNRARFGNADLRDVNAFGAVMSGASFAGADLGNASFVGTSLRGSDFTGAKLEGTNFSGADLSQARGLTQTQLNRACGDALTQLPHGLAIASC
ncbi:pentapeptide repeat-containing protein [Brevundimonas sp. GN22]